MAKETGLSAAAIKRGPEYRAKRTAGFLYSFFRGLLLIGLSYIVLYPIIFMLSTAVRSPADYYDPTVIWLPKHFSLEAFGTAARLLNYGKTFGNTMLISVGASLIQVAICAMVAYGLARYSFKGKGIMIVCIILTIIVPSQTIIVPLYEQYRYFDFFGISRLLSLIFGGNFTVKLTDTVWVYYLPALLGNGLRAGLFILIFMQTFRGFPKSIEEAAWIDGCGHFRCYTSIMIPNAVNSFVTVFLFSFVWHWNDYYYSGMLMNGTSTLSLALRNLSSTASATFSNQSDPIANAVCVQAGCLLVILPILLVFFFGQKAFVESIERTGMVE